MTRLVLWGLGLWAAGTVALRLVGQHLLGSGQVDRPAVLFAVSFPAVSWLVRALCRRAGVSREDWPVGAIALLSPTLLLDPFSSAFFPVVFPNIDPRMAGVFGGWMLWCCAAGLFGTLPRQRRP